MTNYSFTCGFCEKPFSATRSDALYCSTPCRKKAHRRLVGHEQRARNKPGCFFILDSGMRWAMKERFAVSSSNKTVIAPPGIDRKRWKAIAGGKATTISFAEWNLIRGAYPERVPGLSRL